jgi:hypothetical protein
MFALIGAGGIAFDYARFATLDTEMQRPPTRQALAAATQLDRADGGKGTGDGRNHFGMRRTGWPKT